MDSSRLKQLQWLIVEDALRDQKGHWFGYITTFRRGLQALGDEVTILADREAQPFILEHLKAIPILPHSIWHRMSDGANPLIRYLRLPTHSCLADSKSDKTIFRSKNHL